MTIPTTTRTSTGIPPRRRRCAPPALNWLNSLTPDQRKTACFDYVDGERIFWYYPPLNRHGLLLREMDDNQRGLAYALMASGLSPEANRQARAIMDHELILGPLEVEQNAVTYPRDPLLYSWSVFGDPASDEQPWGWRVEGHHVSLHLQCPGATGCFP